MKTEEYKRYVKAHAKKSPVLRDCFAAFWVGGSICAVGQGLRYLYRAAGLSPEAASTTVTVTLIFVAAVLTAVGWFDNIARYAGAGTLVPVTGFANAVVSPAIDDRSEGWIMGVGAKIFTVAGPVILYATLCGALYGVVYYIVSLFL